MMPAKIESGSVQKKWRKVVAGYQNPDIRRSIWQLTNTLVLYILLWILMVLSLKISYWLTLLLAPIAAGMYVRLFIIFHDCGHGSFFKSSKANHWVGTITGVLVFTPYFYWRQSHAIHHATAGNLDKRGVGDVWTMTVEEYLAASPWKRIMYRAYRNPIIMFGIGPVFMFLISQRIPTPNRSFRKRERNSIHWTNLGLLIYITLLSLLIGFKNFWLIQIPVIWIASSVGVWLFYVQHQFEGVYWERAKNWDFVAAGLEGSSFYKLPKILQWFTGNIGFHHIHHLSPRIPNYLLEKCHQENKIFQVKPVDLLTSLKSLTFRLWDEKTGQLVHFRYLKKYRLDPVQTE
jgi:omega-6 fatty acid desaturase (delta-12 desaturase)